MAESSDESDTEAIQCIQEALFSGASLETQLNTRW